MRLLLVRLFGRRKRALFVARYIRAFAERMGGVWVILVRLLSLRSDLLGVEFCKELARTQNHGIAQPFAVIRTIADEALRRLGTSFEQVFVEFDEQPLAVRSFGQFHRARLRKDGREVAVRVRDAAAAMQSQGDVHYLKILLRLAKFFNLEPHLRWDDLVFEAQKIAHDQIDFRVELTEIRRIRRILRRRKVYIPQVFSQFCSEQLLVVEFIHGVPISDLQWVSRTQPQRCMEWFEANQCNPHRVWRHLFNTQQELLQEHNLFYTELLPSSILLLRDNRIALVNYNAIATLGAALLRQYRQLLQALLCGDHARACDIYLTMGPALPYKDVTAMRIQVMRVLRLWETRTHIKTCPYEEKALSAAIGSLMTAASEQQLPSFWNLARLQLAEKTLEATLSYLDPAQNFLKALRRYERASQQRAIKRAAAQSLKKRANSMMDGLRLAGQVVENFEHDGDYFRRRLLVFHGQVGRAPEILGRLFRLFATAALVTLGILGMFQLQREPLLLALRHELEALGYPALTTLFAKQYFRWVLLGCLLLGFRWTLQRLARRLLAADRRLADIR